MLKISNLDQIANGTVNYVYKKCGKSNCKCFSDDDYKHGPYYVWTRKEKGITVTRTLNKNQAQKCLNAIKNMEKLDRLIERWKKKSIKEILTL